MVKTWQNRYLNRILYKQLDFNGIYLIMHIVYIHKKLVIKKDLRTVWCMQFLDILRKIKILTIKPGYINILT